MINKTAEKENPLFKVDKEGFSVSVKISSDKMLAHLIIETSEKDADVEISEDELVQQIAKPGWVIDKIQEIAKPAIRKGAGILVPDDNILSAVLFEAGVTEIDGVPIMDTVAVMVKAAEFLVDLEQAGISRSKSGLYSRLSKEELASVRDAFHIK